MSITNLPTSYVVEKQVPGFVRENHDKFVQFLTTYYEYLDQEENINDYIRNVIRFIDPDTTTDYLLTNFFDELKNLPKDMLADKRFVAKHIYDLYDAKGTPKAIELLFRILYGEDISITYPSDSILRGSDGIWKQDAFFTVSGVIGNLPVGNVRISISIQNEYGNFTILTNKIVYDSSNNTFRIFYEATDRLRLVLDQYVIKYDSAGNKEFVGKLQKSPSKLVVLSGGKFWQLGTIVRMPGSISDTYAIVTNVTGDGAMVTLDVIDYGYGNTEGEIITVSPFLSKPSGSSVDIVYNAGTYTISIIDYLNYGMEVNGDSSRSDTGAYFDEDYVSDIYSGSTQISTNFSTLITGTQQQEDITINDWIASKATIQIYYDLIGKPRGSWIGNKGQVSNSYIRLQDNKYYQMFSYAIRTTNCINKWRKALDIIHPAGLKYFGDFIKQYNGDVSYIIEANTDIIIT